MTLCRMTLSLLAMAALCGCGPQVIRPVDTQINTRTKSPDGDIEAVYAEDVGGGPAVGATEEIFVVEVGRFPTLRERVFSEECVHNLTARWISPRNLQVSYEVAADIHEHSHPFRPFAFTVFSNGYWTFEHPHGVQVHWKRNVTEASGGC